MRALVATRASKLDALLFRERAVDRKKIKACLDGERPTYSLHWNTGRAYLELHPVLRLSCQLPAKEDGAHPEPVICMSYPRRRFRLGEIPLAAHENCTSPPVNHVHLCWENGDQGEYPPEEWTLDCDAHSSCVKSHAGEPITVGQLLAALSQFSARAYEHCPDEYKPLYGTLDGWTALVPHPRQQDVINFAGPFWEDAPM